MPTYSRRKNFGGIILQAYIYESILKKTLEPLAKVGHSVIPANPGSGSGAGTGIQNRLKILDSGSRFACPE
jgi:hypothetical protein